MVEIPADVAKRYAQYLRDGYLGDQRMRDLHDLLDPKPRTLRDEAANAVAGAVSLCEHTWGDGDSFDAADAVLAVVADAPIEQLIALVGPRFADWRDDARAGVDRLTGALGAIAALPSASKPVRDIARDALLDIRL